MKKLLGLTLALAIAPAVHSAELLAPNCVQGVGASVPFCHTNVQWNFPAGSTLWANDNAQGYSPVQISTTPGTYSLATWIRPEGIRFEVRNSANQIIAETTARALAPNAPYLSVPSCQQSAPNTTCTSTISWNGPVGSVLKVHQLIDPSNVAAFTGLAPMTPLTAGFIMESGTRFQVFNAAGGLIVERTAYAFPATGKVHAVNCEPTPPAQICTGEVRWAAPPGSQLWAVDFHQVPANQVRILAAPGESFDAPWVRPDGLRFEVRTPTGSVISSSESRSMRVAEVKGGQVYAWYEGHRVNDFDYGVLQNYFDARPVPGNPNATVRDFAKTQLVQMRASGMKSIKVPVYHCQSCNSNGSANGTAFGSQQWPYNRRPLFLEEGAAAKIAALLSDIQTAGFTTVVLSSYALYESNPNNWSIANSGFPLPNPTTREQLAKEAGGVASELYWLGKGTNLDVVIEVMTEALPCDDPKYAPDPNTYETEHRAFLARVWSYYLAGTYTGQGSMGFSIQAKNGTADICLIPSLKAGIYGGTYPSHFGMHIYDFGAPFPGPAEPVYKDLYRALQPYPEMMNAKWIIGETFMEDAANAKAFRDAVLETGKQIHSLYSWPLKRSEWQWQPANPIAITQFGTLLPYTEYAAKGF